ncbi:hypothetical protein NEIMUCOT_05410 [Neisseria mucosa ATCC 25996]|uniref:Uncharacterized protein n=1 Tax=Neisseria mucosa (strain ATCC 25996 / DSM 4631 / NCTC 10774 / M26) TaxID=546266 RepID=D2ZXQ6_NEIM2|nr:hypothetical protein NEIMUCOT_05410 [Neisseria mucosa ATCC 25996]
MIRRFRRPENAKCGVSANCKREAAFRRPRTHTNPPPTKTALMHYQGCFAM